MAQISHSAIQSVDEKEDPRKLYLPNQFGPTFGVNDTHPQFQAAAATQNAAMTHLSPYLSLAHINPWMANP